MRLALSLVFPFPHYFKNLGCTSGKLKSEHKYWELEHYYCSTDLINFELQYTTKQDHAGLSIELGLLGYSIHFQVYDNRHWNREKNRYVNYDNPEEVEKYW